MPSVRQVVQEEVRRGLDLPDSAPDDVRLVVDRHCEHLVALASSMRAIGKDSDAIRSTVAGLLAIYRKDLQSVLGANG